MAPVVFRACVDLPLHQRRELASILAAHHTLGQAVRWGLELPEPGMVSQVVKQDEYTHDVVMPIGAGVYAVYDST